jgi:hypothetical protein
VASLLLGVVVMVVLERTVHCTQIPCQTEVAPLEVVQVVGTNIRQIQRGAMSLLYS